MKETMVCDEGKGCGLGERMLMGRFDVYYKLGGYDAKGPKQIMKTEVGCILTDSPVQCNIAILYDILTMF